MVQSESVRTIRCTIRWPNNTLLLGHPILASVNVRCRFFTLRVLLWNAQWTSPLDGTETRVGRTIFFLVIPVEKYYTNHVCRTIRRPASAPCEFFANSSHRTHHTRDVRPCPCVRVSRNKRHIMFNVKPRRQLRYAQYLRLYSWAVVSWYNFVCSFTYINIAVMRFGRVACGPRQHAVVGLVVFRHISNMDAIYSTLCSVKNIYIYTYKKIFIH